MTSAKFEVDSDGDRPSQDKPSSSAIPIVAAVIITAIVVAVITVPTTYYLHPDYTEADSAPLPACDITEPPSSARPPVATSVQPTEPTNPENARFDCGPDRGGIDQTVCEGRGCTWDEPSESGPPTCFFPEDYAMYEMNEFFNEPWGYRAELTKKTNTPDFIDGSLDTLWVDVEEQTKHRLHIKIYDPNNERFEVPIPLPPSPATAAEDKLYHVAFTEEPFSFQVIRTDTETVVFDTSVGALIFEDQFLQLSTKLPSHNVYGFGEHEHESFRHDLNWRRWGSFARDQPPSAGANLYGTHPFYLCLENDYNAHGVFLNNANAQDVSLQPTPALTYRHIGGIFDFYMFFGPTPADVVSQYTETIGRPYLPPYWSLGFHLSRYGYNGIDKVKEVVARMRQYNIPHDVQYGDIDYMDRQKDFTIDEEAYGEVALRDFVNEIKEEGTNYIIILDPAIAANETTGTYRPYDDGVTKDVFIHDENDEILYGKVWPDYPDVEVDDSKEWDYQTEFYRSFAAFPDFQRPQTKEWWSEQVNDFHKKIPFDGIWIDMNEPANFVVGSVTGCTDNKYDFPPYHPQIWGATMADKTLCMNALQNLDETSKTVHYNMHNLYGWSQNKPTLDAARQATGKRSLVVTRSTFAGSGQYSGHWLGDNASIWPHMHKSIIGMLEFNLFGVPFIGADICGFFDDTTEDLCRRWSQLGNFYPFARNHNGLNYRDQDPAAFGEEFAVNMRDLFAIRYTLLPYLYTLHYKATAYGHTVVRPLMFEFTSDSETWGIDRQFLWGSGLMITPVLDEGGLSVDAYIPNTRWYDWYTGIEVDQTNVGKWVTIGVPDYYIPLHIRGGNIIPIQQPANSTKFSRENPFGLIVALSEWHSALGTLFWDDGTTADTIENGEYYKIEYVVAQGNLIASVVNSFGNILNGLNLETITVHGIANRPPWVKLNGMELNDSQWMFDDVTKILSTSDLAQPMMEQFMLSWH